MDKSLFSLKERDHRTTDFNGVGESCVVLDTTQLLRLPSGTIKSGL